MSNGKDLINIPGGEDLPIPPMAGLAAVALNMALSYLDSTTVKDGQMYQQLKLEGRNINYVDLDTAFDYAKRIEIHLMGASDRFSKIIVDALAHGLDELQDNEPVGPFIDRVLVELGYDRKHAARTIGVPDEDFDKILDGETALTQEVAEKLEEHFKMPADELMNIQDCYNQEQVIKNTA